MPGEWDAGDTGEAGGGGRGGEDARPQGGMRSADARDAEDPRAMADASRNVTFLSWYRWMNLDRGCLWEPNAVQLAVMAESRSWMLPGTGRYFKNRTLLSWQRWMNLDAGCF